MAMERKGRKDNAIFTVLEYPLPSRLFLDSSNLQCMCFCDAVSHWREMPKEIKISYTVCSFIPHVFSEIIFTKDKKYFFSSENDYS